MTSSQITFSDPEVQRCPFSAYEEVRALGPVYRDPVTGNYVVTDYELVRQIANDAATFSSVTGKLLVQELPGQDQVDAIFKEHGYLPINTLVVSDAPDHTFYRSLVDKAFTPVRVRQMEDYLNGVVEDLIDRHIDDGQIEFMSKMANIVPMSVISDQLGVPRSDIETFKRWSEAVLSQAYQSHSVEERIKIAHTICELQRYIAEKAEEYRKTPRECMLSDLVHAEVGGRRLTMQELVAICTQLLVAGNDTTTSVMGSCMYRIIQEPGLEERLRSDSKLIPQFIEEVLRLASPVQGLWRRAVRDTEIGGVQIPAESIMLIKYGAANRDPAKFECPAHMNIERSNVRQHLTFGHGAHFCIGNQLARAELRIAIGKLLQRMKNFRLTYGDEGVEYISHVFNFGLTKLHISFDRV
ncbi:cytochrome P450 [Noviherbaspirillum sedimenti]|uniref:Cytochrome P450 n=1 Tax=Noviherbaspirillum sedimenti TaxID=2320865 RepID=A0A3A3GGF7_9BURK|nr:cytochrome P450 [Noviherbaspirillum sedimenti]RJG01356.1 cytochrome P450 [Noviherbaspirillum sedimenti]